MRVDILMTNKYYCI